MMNIKINEKYKASIYDQENEGLGVSKIDDVIVFIQNGLPDEEGEVLITEVKKNYARGRMISFTSVSPNRQQAPCPYYDECGGCDLQHQKYSEQLSFKEHKVRTALERIGGLKGIKINKIISDDDFYYRNKVSLKVSGDKLGFYKRGSYEIIDIENCIISNKKINDAIKVLQSFIREHNDNTFKTIMIRYCNGLMIDIKSDDNTLESPLVSYLLDNLHELKSLFLNDELLFGEKYIEEKIGEFTFKLSSASFFQINNNVMEKLYQKVLEYVGVEEKNVILDLYCGIGTITSFLAQKAKRVFGIEMVKPAIDNAIINASLNDINNVIFMHGKVEELITSLLDEKIDTIVMDPPRSGVDKVALDAIMEMKPESIIYVSCNPVTLARDLKILGNEYEFIEATPFDMFPQTSHVETVVLLEKK